MSILPHHLTLFVNGAKTDLSDLLGNLRSGGYKWVDYFGVLHEAISFRVSIDAPQGTDALKRKFSEVLTLSIQYCNQMNASAQIEFKYDLPATQEKYTEAKSINTKEQSSYADFTNNYQAEKARLTNIDNL